MLYCTTLALAGYSSYSVKIPRTRMKALFHICSTTLHAWQHEPSHSDHHHCLRPNRTEPSRATHGFIIRSLPDGRLATMCVMTSARYCGFYYFGDKGADHCGKGDNRNPDGDKEPLETI